MVILVSCWCCGEIVVSCCIITMLMVIVVVSVLVSCDAVLVLMLSYLVVYRAAKSSSCRTNLKPSSEDCRSEQTTENHHRPATQGD